MKAIAPLLAAMMLAMLVGGCASDAASHAMQSNDGNWYPAPGYTFANSIPNDYSVRWEPGKTYKYLGNIRWPHVLAANNEGTWNPAPGYSWVHPDVENDLAVQWTPGIAYQYLGEKWPSIIAGDTEGAFCPAPGYMWTHPDAYWHSITDDLNISWKSGIPYYDRGNNQWPHVISSTTEGIWYPEPGYRWAHLDANGNPTSDDLAVRWFPGSDYLCFGSVKWPKVIAADTEESWYPAPGYVFAHLDDNGHLDPNDMSVRWMPGIESNGWYSKGNYKWPNLIASDTEGSWYPSPGYTWAHPGSDGSPPIDDCAVVWKPGSFCWDRARLLWPYVLASDNEGQWSPLAGFAWAHPHDAEQPPDDDLQVVALSPGQAAPSLRKLSDVLVSEVYASRSTLEQHWQDYLKEIQDHNDYPNWSGPPYDLYQQHQQKQTTQ
ncbi:MAG: hypothetical protein ABSB74_20680 [Tepidisphaeraceae bacterium]